MVIVPPTHVVGLTFLFQQRVGLVFKIFILHLYSQREIKIELNSRTLREFLSSFIFLFDIILYDTLYICTLPRARVGFVHVVL
jgi:hypothetical protein